MVKGAIALLKRRNPRTRVLVSVGGATYTAWDRLNATAISAFVRQFGLDGVDVDYEGDGCEPWMGASGCVPAALSAAAWNGQRPGQAQGGDRSVA